MEGPVLVAPVHMSMLDPPLLGCTSPRALRFMAKEELFRPPGLSHLIRSLGAFPVRRGENDTAAIRLALERLSLGEAVLVFPEGTRNDGRTMLPIQVGLAMLAKRTGATILPVGIAGTEKVLPKGASRPRRARVTVAYGHPFRYEDVAEGLTEREARKAFAAELGRRIQAACVEAGHPIAPAPETPA